MTEDEVRGAFKRISLEMINDWRREQRAAGIPLEAIEVGATLCMRIVEERIERDVPVIMKNMAISAGATKMQ